MSPAPRPPVVALVGAFDTKAAEYEFMAARVREAGCRPLLVDVGVLGEPGLVADVTRSQVATRAGRDLGQLRSSGERGPAMTAMAAGVAELLADLVGTEQVHGVLAAGGSNAAFVMARICERLPLGLPKVLVSTMASGDTSPYVGASDLVMMNPVVDVNGLNRVTRPVLANAANAVTGMVLRRRTDVADDAPVVGVSMFGVTTACAMRITETLAAAGVESLSFHANGAGGRAMESLVASGHLQVVADMTTTELADELLGGVCTAGPDRLTAASRAGVPQVVSLGALDMVNFGARASVPRHLHDRLFYEHNPEVTLMRTDVEDCRVLGTALAERLNAATGPCSVVIPTQGFSMISVPGGPFHDPVADATLIAALTSTLGPHVGVHVLETHVNDPAVADTIAELVVQSVRALTPGDRP